MFKPAKDWVSAFPEDEGPKRKLPPARPRKRPVPQDTVPEANPRTAKPSVKNPRDPEEGPDSIVPEKSAEEMSPGAVYYVGYKKPPVHGQFKPGQSGNPKGRPKGAKGLNTMVREILGSKVAVRTPNGVKKISKIEAVLQKTVEKALSGDPRAQMELVKLWKNAVPELQQAENSGQSDAEDLTASDLAILEAFRADLAEKGGRSCN